jgi:hypothetical protein
MGRPSRFLPRDAGPNATTLVGPGQAARAVHAGPCEWIRPVVRIQIKSFIFFLFNSDSIQILENHIYSNIAPKIMKPILLDS